MAGALRIAIHLEREVEHPLFFKVAADPRHVTHVAKVYKEKELDELKPYIQEAYDFSLRKASKR